jgi:hypothetical protein
VADLNHQVRSRQVNSPGLRKPRQTSRAFVSGFIAPVAAQDCHLVRVGGCCRHGHHGEQHEQGRSRQSPRNHDGEISHKHGNTLIGTLRKLYGQGFAAGYLGTEKLSEVLLQLNETSLSQLRRDHETGHLEHKIANASK